MLLAVVDQCEKHGSVPTQRFRAPGPPAALELICCRKSFSSLLAGDAGYLFLIELTAG
jgi:hypothetical protein